MLPGSRTAAGRSGADIVFLDAEPPQEPCTECAGSPLHSRNHNHFQDFLFKPTTSRSKISDFSQREEGCFSARPPDTALSVGRRGRWRGGGWAGRHGVGGAGDDVPARRTGRSPHVPSTDFLHGCVTSQHCSPGVPCGGCVHARGGGRGQRGKTGAWGPQRELRGGCHSASAQGRRMPAAHFLSEGHQGQIPVNTHTLIRLADKMVSVATPGQSVACIRH